MKQIKTQTYPPHAGYAGQYGGAAKPGHSYFPGTGGLSNQGKGRAGTLGNPQTGKTQGQGSVAASKNPFPASTPSTNSGGMRQGPSLQAGNYQKSLAAVEAGGNLGKANADEEEEDRLLRQQLAEGHSPEALRRAGFGGEFRGQAFGFNIHDFYSGLYDQSENREIMLHADSREDEEERNEAFLQFDINTSLEQEACLILDEVVNSPIPFGEDPRFDELSIDLGKYRASCLLFVEMASSLFQDEDEIINNIIFEYYQMLTESGKGKLFRGLIEILPEAEKRKVEMYGL